jgi:PAS domain S-box-containing protein
MASRPFGSFAHPDDQDVDVALYGELLAGTRDKYEVEKRFVTRSGKLVWGQLIVTLIKDADGVPLYAIDMLHDITERKQTELDLHRTSERLHLATNAAGIGIWDWDVVNDELVWDDATYRLFGIRKEDFTGAYDAWANALVADDLERAEAAVAASLDGKREFALDFRIIWPDGSVRVIRGAAQTFRNSAGKPVRMIGVNYDITERRRSEESLRWSEEQLRLLLDSTAEGIFGVDLAGRCTFCNAAGIRLLGYDAPAQLLGQNMHETIAHSYADGTHYPLDECPAVRSLQTASRAFADKDVFWRKDGTCFPVAYWSHPMRRAGKHVGAVVTFSDITDRREAEESLRLSEERFAKAFHSSPEPISVFRDSDGVLLEVNERWSTTYGYSRDEAVGHTSLALKMIDPDTREILRSLLDLGEPFRDVEIDLRTKEGAIRRISLTSERIVINNELCNIFLHRDITDRKQAEESLRLSEERFAKAFDSSPEPITILRDRDDVLLEVNERWLTVYGYPREEAIGRTPVELGMAGDETRAEFRARLDGDRPLRDVWVDLKTKSGEIRHVGISSEKFMFNGELCNIFLHRDVTERKRAEEKNARLIHDLGERVKELTALHQTARILQDESKPVADWLQEIVELLPPSWQYPEVTAGCICFGELTFTTQNYRESPWSQKTEFSAGGRRGVIEVVYLEECPEEYFGPFLLEEKNLLESLAEMIGTALNRRYVQAALTESEVQTRATSEQLRALSASLRRAKEDEGIRIARELHDELGSSLTSLKWNLLSLDQSGNLSATGRRGKIEDMLELVDATINTVRRISSELRPSVLDDLGLVSAIEWHSQQFEANSRVVCRFESQLEQVELSRERSTAIFRIYQEAMTNILRHAQATKVNVLIEGDDQEFLLEIRDNGRGITDTERMGLDSLGLLGMRERAHAIGGKVEINGVAGQGTVLLVRIPLKVSPPAAVEHDERLERNRGNPTRGAE